MQPEKSAFLFQDAQCCSRLNVKLLFIKQNIFFMTTNIQNYEMMLIFTPVLAEEDFRSSLTKITSFIQENGGTIVHENPWGLRSLAYPIQKKTTGLYAVLEYQAPTELNAKLEIQLNRNESVMRHMITHLDKFALAYNERKRNAPAKVKETKEETQTEETAS